MTAIVYFGEMLVASLLAIVLLAISQLRMSSDALLFAGGVVGWTLAEYIVHRFVLHGFASSEHRLHHANPGSSVLAVFWQIWICFALVYLIVGGCPYRKLNLAGNRYRIGRCSCLMREVCSLIWLALVGACRS